MSAVFAPCLGDGFKFNICWVASFFAKIFLNCFHLCQVKRGAAIFGNSKQFVIGQVADWNNFHSSTGFSFLRKRWRDVAKSPMVDDSDWQIIVWQVYLQKLIRSTASLKCKDKSLTCGCALDSVKAKLMRSADNLLGYGVGDAGAEGNFQNNRIRLRCER